ncbi:hypothetical protein E8P82_00975 [Arthrobacter echini]|uniref:Uncharacterized protein n=1 Tax=Arthrobacter echini TaxID=1529066 RepID=A0A4S5EA30_9MICC|nr:hypothetical protein [Arthrobacter echini]THJ68518.1 hypothetical protein E8P82_00975 [Arthrobacter echini]
MQTSPVVKVLAAWVLAILLIVACCSALVAAMNSRLYSPEHRVERYLGALQEGDGGQALGLLDAAVPEGVDPSLLDGDALRAASAPLEDIEVQDARDTGADRVEVPVSYQLDGAAQTTLFELEQTGTTWGVFDVWEFTRTTLPTLRISAPTLDMATVNGMDVGLGDGATDLASFYPAIVTAQVSGPYLTSPQQQAVVTGSGDTPAQLDLATTTTPELEQAVTDRVHAFLDSCAAQAVFQPTGCPFAYVTTEPVAADVVWTIEEYPSVTIMAEDGGWALAPLEGSARLETTFRDYFSGAETDISESIAYQFEADLTVTGNAVTVTPIVDD